MNYKKFLFVFTIIGIIYYILSNYVFINGGGGSNATTPPSTSPPPPVDPFFNGVTSLTAAFSNTATPLPTQPPAPSTSPAPPTSPSSSDLQIIIDNTTLNEKDNKDAFNRKILYNYFINVYDSNGKFYGPIDTQMNYQTENNQNKNIGLKNTFFIPINGYLILNVLPSKDPDYLKSSTKLTYNYLKCAIKNNKNNPFTLYIKWNDITFNGSLIDKSCTQ